MAISTKKRVVTCFHNLPLDLQAELRKMYPLGFTDHMIRIDKPDGNFFYGVVFETEDTNYLVKIDVKIDDKIEEEEDKEYFDEDIKGADELADANSDDDDSMD